MHKAPLAREGPFFDQGCSASACTFSRRNRYRPLATMIAAYTINGAWLVHHERENGSIEVGKQADIVVVDRNLFEIPGSDRRYAGAAHDLQRQGDLRGAAEGGRASADSTRAAA